MKIPLPVPRGPTDRPGNVSPQGACGGPREATGARGVDVTGWDVTPSGVESILSLVGLAADELGKDIKGYGKSVEEAALRAGTISGPYCGSAPVGPVGSAVADFVSDTESQVTFMVARIKKTMDGTVDATTAYVDGDLAMAARAQREAAKVPSSAELRAVTERADRHGGGRTK
ncbi:DUF6507 family protein [Streptomyces sp. NPDC006743]|uniref:DUF6507 family protein n=1 Tax=Streptomyces sp. NPDC006743 TaxID=3154480 RepID=UPI003451810F